MCFKTEKTIDEYLLMYRVTDDTSSEQKQKQVKRKCIDYATTLIIKYSTNQNYIFLHLCTYIPLCEQIEKQN